MIGNLTLKTAKTIPIPIRITGNDKNHFIFALTYFISIYLKSPLTNYSLYSQNGFSLNINYFFHKKGSMNE